MDKNMLLSGRATKCDHGTNEVEKDRAFWITITESEGYGRRAWYIPSAPPCNKGEVGIRAFGRKIVWGWGEGAPEVFDDGSETCQACGSPYDMVWWADADVWEAIAGTPDGEEGLYCPMCFDAMAHEEGISLRWTCSMLTAPEAEEEGA